jgi:hypothetical protein
MRSTHPGGDPPPRPIICRSVKAGEQAIFKFLGGPAGCLLHYKSETYTPCTGESTCPKNVHALKTIWRGFAPCHEWDQVAFRWWAVALEVTENLDTFLRGRELPGEIWLVQRSNSSRKTSSLVGEYLERVECNGAHWFDPRAVVENRYRVQGILWNVPNHVPAKLIQPAIEAPPPSLVELAESIDARTAEALSPDQRQALAGRLADAWRRNNVSLNGKAGVK